MQSQATVRTETPERGDTSGGSDPAPTHAAKDHPQHVAICVCTCRRPKLLAKCLDSLGAQMVDDSIQLRIIVVSNGPGHLEQTQAVVESFDRTSRYPVTFVHEPKQNIATARNIAALRALSYGVDWIAFIDDDETADPDWIANLMAPEWRQYPVLMGQQIFIYPEPLPFWVVAAPAEDIPEPLRRMNAATYNVRFSAQLLRAGLLFDERLGSSGGEDTDFFVRGRKVGFEIRKISTAITREHTHPERFTYRGQIYRAYWKAVADMKRIRLEGGSTGLIWRRAHTIPLQMISGLAHLCIGITAGAVSLLRPSSKHRLLAIYKRRALRGGRKIAKSAGRLAAMVGHDPQPYRTIHGE